MCGPKDSQPVSQATVIVQAPSSGVAGFPSNVLTVVTQPMAGNADENKASNVYSSASFIAPQPIKKDSSQGVAKSFKRVFTTTNELEKKVTESSNENNVEIKRPKTEPAS